MRNDASNLNLYLLHHHLSVTSAYPHCNDPYENPTHLFIHCPHYATQRQELLNTFVKLNIDFNIQNILYGSQNCNFSNNEKLTLAVHLFVKNSKRFN